jgi:hypothetical protein
VGDAALFLNVPKSVTEQALVNLCTVVHRVSISFTPLTVYIALVGAVLPSIHEVIEVCIKHSPGDIQGCQGIVEDVWLEAAEGIGVDQCA